MKLLNNMAAGLVAVMGVGTAVHSQELTNLHPSFAYTNLMPAGFNPPGIGGLDFLGNDGVICTWGGSSKTAGDVYIIPGLATGTPGTPVKLPGTPLQEALGLRVVDGVIYVITKPELFKYTKQTDGSWTRSSLAKGWNFTGNWHHFAFSLVHKDGFLYFNTGVAYEPDVNEDPQRGSVIKVNMATGAFTALVKGMRNANGLGLGPEGELFTTDNEGHWVPTNKVMHIKEGRFYGYRTNKNYTAGTTVTPPAIWLPYGTYSNSPSRLLLLKAGPYAGQMLAGDVHHGGIQRYFLEKVGGEYQGACFRFSQGIGYGVNELVPGPDGNIYVAGIGGGCCGMDGSGNWNFQGKNNGLGRLNLTTTVPFEIKAMRSVAGGFEVEFTAPAGAAAATLSNYVVQSWTNTPGPGYGEGRDMSKETTNQATKVELSADKKFATISVSNLRTNRVYFLKVNAAVTAEGGGALRTGEAWYTLNNLGPSTAVRQAQNFSRNAGARFLPGAVSIDLPFTHPYRVELMGLDGRRMALAEGNKPGALDIRAVPSGIYVLTGKVERESFSQKVRIP
jgi:hypothetical protein